MLATFIASLAARYRMSRPKIRELLNDWLSVELSVGTIDRCIREVGIACSPVVDELIEELQSAEIIHIDETPWYEKGNLRWLWVAISSTIAVYHIGSRRKEELLHLITDAFLGWLVTDGYGAYSTHPKRQHCLATFSLQIKETIMLNCFQNAPSMGTLSKINSFSISQARQFFTVTIRNDHTQSIAA
jgi:transposase